MSVKKIALSAILAATMLAPSIAFADEASINEARAQLPEVQQEYEAICSEYDYMSNLISEKKTELEELQNDIDSQEESIKKMFIDDGVLNIIRQKVHNPLSFFNTVSIIDYASPSYESITLNKSKADLESLQGNIEYFEEQLNVLEENKNEKAEELKALEKEAGKNIVVERAMSKLGSPYVWGATGKNGAFDCSGFVGYALTGTTDRIGTTYTFMG